MIYFKSILVRGGAAFLGLVSQYLTIKFLGEKIYGEYVSAIALVAFVSIFAKMGSDVSIQRAGSSAWINFNLNALYEVRKKSLNILVPNIAVVVLVCYLLKYSDLVDFLDGFGWGIILMLVGLSVSSQLGIMCRSIGENLYADILENLFRPIIFVAMLFFVSVAGHRIGLDEAQFFYFCALSVLSVFYFIKIDKSSRRHCSQTDSLTGYVSIDKVKQSFPVVITALSSYGLFQFDTLVAGIYLEPETVGAYNVACNYVRLVIFLPMIVAAYIQPEFVRLLSIGDVAGYKRCVSKWVLVVVVWSAAVCFFFLLFSEKIMTLTSEKYVGLGWLFYILGFGHCANSVSLILVTALNMRKGEYFVMKATLVGALISSVLLFFLAENYGLLGISVAAMSGMLSMTLLNYYFYKKVI